MSATSQRFAVATAGALDEVHERVVEVAKREHGRVMHTAPIPTRFTRFVDGVAGAPEEAVKPNGVITYLYPRIDQVVLATMEALYDFSPVLSGRYRLAHTLFINGVPASDLSHWKPADEVSIANPLPYSRKIELGKMTMRVSRTSMVYQRARRRVLAEWRGGFNIKFTYRAIVATGRQVNQQLAASSGQPWWLGGAAARPATGEFEATLGRTAHNASNIRFPTLIITER